MTDTLDSGDARVEELLRVNAELATEIRNLTLGRADAPRSTLLTAARGIAAAVGERDRRIASLEAESKELRELRELVERQVLELELLRAGPLGLLRRAQARILRGRANRGGGA